MPSIEVYTGNRPQVIEVLRQAGPPGPQGVPGTPGSAGGDMLKSVYDVDDDNIVDNSEAVPWAGVVGGDAAIAAELSNLYFSADFTDASLSVAGIYIANHGFGKTPNSIVLKDETGQVVQPDSAQTVAPFNATAIGVDSYRPLVGTWNISLGV